MVTALCNAAEEGNLDGVKALLEEATNFDVNTRNKVGNQVSLHGCLSFWFVVVVPHRGYVIS